MSELSRRAIYSEHEFAIDRKYRVEKALGKGTYGIVCQATEINADHPRPIAIKKVKKIFNYEVLVKRAFRELRIMRYLRGHKNIVSLFDLDMIATKPYDGLYCYQELMDYDLGRVICGAVQISELHVQSFTYQVLCGVKYMHSANIVHRDLKPGNLLVNSLGQLKICDFGLARGIESVPSKSSNYRVQYTEYVATRWYRAPELLIRAKSYNGAIDIWSVGCILCELIGRKPVFKGDDQWDQLRRVFSVIGLPSRQLVVDLFSREVWKVCLQCHSRTKSQTPLSLLYPNASPLAVDLIAHLLDFDFRSRYTAIQALEHGFLRHFHDAEDEPICEQQADFGFELLQGEQLRDALMNEIRSFRDEVRAGELEQEHPEPGPQTISQVKKKPPYHGLQEQKYPEGTNIPLRNRFRSSGIYYK